MVKIIFHQVPLKLLFQIFTFLCLLRKVSLTVSLSNKVMQEEEHPGQEEEEEERRKKTEGDEEQQDVVEEPEGENPLEKYMKMVLEAREKQPTQVSFSHISENTEQICSHKEKLCFKLSVFVFIFFQSSVREEAGQTSPEAKSLFEEKEDR